MPFRCTSRPDTSKGARSFNDNATAGRRLAPTILIGCGNPAVVTIEGSMRAICG